MEDDICVSLLAEWLLELFDTKERTLYTLFYRNGMTIREIAKITELAEGTIKYQLFQLRKKIAFYAKH